MTDNSNNGSGKGADESRRAFFSNVFMGAGLVLSHIFAGGLLLRYLYLTKNDQVRKGSDPSY